MGIGVETMPTFVVPFCIMEMCFVLGFQFCFVLILRVFCGASFTYKSESNGYFLYITKGNFLLVSYRRKNRPNVKKQRGDKKQLVEQEATQLLLLVDMVWQNTMKT